MTDPFNKQVGLVSNTWNPSNPRYINLWEQFLPRPRVALVVIFGLESPTLERYISSFYLIRHEPMERGNVSF